MKRLDYMAALTQLYYLDEESLAKITSFIVLYAAEGEEQPDAVSFKNLANRYKDLWENFKALEDAKKQHTKPDLIEFMAIYNLFKHMMEKQHDTVS